MEGAQKSEKEKEARQMPACHVTILFVASAEERPRGSRLERPAEGQTRGSRLERPAEGQRVTLLTRDALAWLALPADGYDADHGPSLNQRRKGLGTWANLERLGSPIESRSLRHTVTLCVNTCRMPATLNASATHAPCLAYRS